MKIKAAMIHTGREPHIRKPARTYRRVSLGRRRRRSVRTPEDVETPLAEVAIKKHHILDYVRHVDEFRRRREGTKTHHIQADHKLLRLIKPVLRRLGACAQSIGELSRRRVDGVDKS